jgi:hypothetical protein
MGHILLQATWIHETPDTNSGARRPSEGADGRRISSFRNVVQEASATSSGKALEAPMQAATLHCGTG